MNPLLLVDSYKIHHYPMYEPGMTKLYSNGTCRKSRLEGVNQVVVFGIQHFVQEYLIKKFNEDFFYTDRRNWQDIAFKTRESHNKLNIHENETIRIKELRKLKSKVIDEYKRHCPVDTTHIEALWDLGYLPIEVKALDEGSLCPIGVPMLTIT
jgi:nicotinamide phosphoribosyltransferase